ncbi:uncharacterized protein LOC8040733 isoform X3 [Ixodes scapularis]|uniref:uncharacterized protein LOC8040733 isoform X3 n=1 Tax=Ixodes scapularis TaxID=6945 RepID=UPI001A9CE55C|nr:uncharacterized protein LOC8040733 isoform X3 [Ixodes scapularis]
MHEPESPTGCNTPQGSASVVAGYHDHQYHKEEQDDGKKNHVGSKISPKLTRFRLRGLQAKDTSKDLDASQKSPSDQRNTLDRTSTAGDARRAAPARDFSSSATSLLPSANSLSSSATSFSPSATSFSSSGVVAGSAPAKNCVVVVSVNHGASEDSDHEVLAEDLAAEEVATTMEVVTMEVETTVEEEDGGRSADSGSTQDDSSFTSATDSQASSNDGLTVKRRRGRPLKGSQSPKVSGAKTMESAASSKVPATRRSVRLRSGDGQRSSSPTPAAAKRGRRSRTPKGQEPEPAKQTTKRHQQETAKRTAREPTRRQQQEAAKEATRVPAKELAKRHHQPDVAKETAKEVAREPAKEPAKRQHQPDVAKEPAKEAAREPAKRQHQPEIAKETIKRQHQPELVKETAKETPKRKEPAVVKETPKREEPAVVKETPKEIAKVPQPESAKEVTVEVRQDISEDLADRQPEATREMEMVVVEKASGQTDVKASEETVKETAKETSKETAQETSEEAVETKPGVPPSIVMTEPVEEEVCTLGEVEEEEKKISEEETKVEATNAGQVMDVVMEEQQGDQKEVVMRLEPLLDTEKRREDRLKSDCSDSSPESLPATKVEVKEEDEVVAATESGTAEPPQPRAQPESETVSEVEAPPKLEQPVSPKPELGDASEPKLTSQPTESKTTSKPEVEPTAKPVAVVETAEHTTTDESKKIRDSKVGEEGPDLEAEEVRAVSADHRDRRYYSSPEKPTVSQDEAPTKVLTPRSARRKSRWEDAPPNDVSEPAVAALDFSDASMALRDGHAEGAGASTYDTGGAEGVALPPPPPPRTTSPQRKEGAVDASGRPEKVKSRWRRSSELETRDVTPPSSAPVTAPSKTPGRDTSSPPRAKVPPSTKVSSPKVSSPKVASPKVSSPKVSSPKVSSPKVSSPKVAGARSTDMKSTDARSTDARSIDARSINARSTDARSTDARSTDARSTDARSTDARSTDARSTDAKPTDMRPARAYDAKEDTKRISTPSREEIREKTPPSTPSRESRDRESRESGRGGESSREKGSPSRSLAYEDIEENLYRFERKKSKCKKEVRRMICDCSLTKDERDRGIMGCEEDCLNRLLMIECGSRCPNGDSCSNRRFQKKSYIKVEKFLTEKKGWGLRTVETLASGAFVIEYVGEVLTPEDFRKRVKQYARDNHQHYYFMALRSDEIIDATQKGNVSRFINHSCDPNCETQKWTVNGELRIGFFTRRPLRAGEELTFDYQFQRYGKEAQKCYCESSKCRGFIGEDNKMSLKSGRALAPKRVSNSSSRRAEERKRDIVEDLAMEEEIERLGGGLRNRKHTLLLARLMVRGEDIETRKRLLNIITSTTETACLRLFLDYHGLSLLWSWMVDIPDNELTLKAEILTVLRRLPIPNKTMVKDSKVMSVVHRWASQLAEARERPRECAGEETPPPPKKQRGKGGANDDSNNGSSSGAASEEAAGGGASDSDASESSNGCTTPASGASRRSLTGAVVCSPDSTNPVENGDSAERPKGPADDGGKVVKELSQLASTLLDSWSELKEVFRIPRLEQQKRREDEREADRKEREHNRQQRSRESSSSAASGRDSRRRGSPPSSGRDRRDHRDYDRSSDRRRYSASPEHRDDKKSYQRSSDSRSSRSGDPAPSSSSKPRKTLLPTPPRLSKEERRQLFALEVQQRDQEEALRRQYLAPPANGANPAPPMPGASFLPPPGMAQAPPPGVVPALVASGPPPQQNPLFVYDPATAAAVAAAMYGAQPPPGPAYYDPRAGMPPQEYVMQHNTMLGGIPPQQQPQPPHQGMPMGAPLLTAGAMLPGQQQMGPMGTLGPPLPMDEGSNQLPPQHAAINYQALSAAVAAVSNLQPRVPSPAAPPPEASIFLTDPMQIPLPPSLSPDTGEVTPQNPDPLSSPPPFEEEEAIAVAQGGFPDASSAEARGAPTQRAPLEYEQIPRVAPSPVQEQTQQVVYPPAQHTPPTSMPYAPPGAMVAATAAPVPAGLFQANPQPMGPYGPGYVAAGPGQPMGAVQGMAQALPQGMPQVYYLPPIPAHAIPAEQPVPVQTREPAPSGRLASPPPQQETAPPRKSSRLPPHWKTAKDEEGNLYYYHALTRETQWDPPAWDEEDQDMDLGTPTYDEPKVNSTVGSMSMKVKKTTSKKKTLTAAADTSEVAKKIKELFRSKISSHIVHCLNPFRKPDCKLGRIQSTEDFKHLARKLTHFVMAKELKHCKNVEDLECNDNVKHKAKEFVHKYMAKYGPLFYKKDKAVSPKDE